MRVLSGAGAALALCLAAALPEREVTADLWQACTALTTARELLREGNLELADLVLEAGTRRLSEQTRGTKLPCRRAPGATGRLLVAARRDLLLAYALTHASRASEAVAFLRAALEPLDRYARFGARDSRAAARALSTELRSSVDSTKSPAEIPSVRDIDHWWRELESLCHGARDGR